MGLDDNLTDLTTHVTSGKAGTTLSEEVMKKLAAKYQKSSYDTMLKDSIELTKLQQKRQLLGVLKSKI